MFFSILDDSNGDLESLKEEKKFTDILFDFFTATTKDQPTFEKFVMKMSIFGAIMFYFWLCDHLHLW